MFSPVSYLEVPGTELIIGVNCLGPLAVAFHGTRIFRQPCRGEFDPSSQCSKLGAAGYTELLLTAVSTDMSAIYDTIEHLS